MKITEKQIFANYTEFTGGPSKLSVVGVTYVISFENDTREFELSGMFSQEEDDYVFSLSNHFYWIQLNFIEHTSEMFVTIEPIDDKSKTETRILKEYGDFEGFFSAYSKGELIDF